jgi:hypothetical protein
MADINFGILDTQLPGRIAAIPQEAQKQQTANMLQAMQMQGSMNQNALSQYTLSKAKREDELTNQLLGDLRSATTDAEIYRAYQRAGKGREASELQSAALARQKLTGEIAAQPGDRAYKEEQTKKLKRDADIANAQHAYENLSRLSTLAGGASDEDISAVIGDAVRTQGLPMSDATRLQKSLLDLPLEQRSQRLALLAGSASDRLRAITPDIRQVTTPTGGVDFRNFAPLSPGFGQTPVGFSNLAPGMTPYQRGSLGVAQGNLSATRDRAADEGIGTYGEYSPRMLRDMAARGMQPDGRTGGQTFIPGGEKDPAVMLAEATAKAQIPKYDRDAGGFITPPTRDNPNGTFVPLTSVQTNKDVQANIKALKMAGYDPVTGKDEISELIKQSTGGVIEAAGAGLAGAINYTTEGAEAIGRLETRANSISFALLNGKLGAGISNEDRKFIERQLGDVANPNTASGKRLAAWKEAKNKMLSLGMLGGATPPAGAAATPARGVDSSNPLLQQ